MDRQINYAGAIPLDTDLLLTNKNVMVGVGFLMQAILGTGNCLDGLACTPTSPASMTVNMAPGSIYSLQNVDNSAYGSLAPDTSDQIVKQGIIQGVTNLACPAPTTTGFSIAYLIQATYQDSDTGSTVLPYYNASNPAVAYNGPNNTGVSQNTVRKGVCLLQVKAGTAATTGTQSLPAADVGAVPVASVTVANGQTTIVSGNIAQLTGSFINTKLPAVLAAIQSGASTYAQDTSGSSGTITAALVPAVAAYTAGLTFRVKSANNCTAGTVMNINGLGNKAIYDTTGNPVHTNQILANSVNTFSYDGTNVVLQSAAGDQYDGTVGQCVLQYTSATQLTLAPRNGNKVVFPNGTLQSIGGGVTVANTGIHIDGTAGQNLASNTLYYVYLVAGGTPYIDFSVTGYTTDANSGLAIKNGDSTRLLVGLIQTNGSSQFVQSATSKQVRSWYNDRGVVTQNNFTAGRSTTSTSATEINSEIRCNIVLFAGENVVGFSSGAVSNGSSGQGVGSGLGVDSTSVISGSQSGGISGTAGNGVPSGTSYASSSLSEGNHFFTLLGFANSSGTASFSAIDFITIATSR